MATMNDIAKHLGITKGTVSKALSGASDISESLRKQVVEAAVEMGYSRIPRTNVKPKICVFIENMEYKKPEDFGWDLVTGFRKSAEPAGYTVDLIDLTTALQKDSSYDAFMMKHDYKGAFFLGINYMDPWMVDFKTCHTPTVVLDNKIPNNPMVVHIGMDNEEAMNLAVRRLKDLGHNTIGYLSGALGSHVYQDRYLAFFHALKKNQLNSSRTLAGHSYSSTECIGKNLPRLISQGCTAVICSHDLLAHALIIYCTDHQIRVPEQLSILGIDDLPLCQYTTPTLSSIRQNRTMLGKSAHYALDAQINQIHINSITLHPEIILRNSSQDRV